MRVAFLLQTRYNYIIEASSRRFQLILSIISGILLALAFPKFSLWPLAWVALVPFFHALYKAKTIRGALLCGLLFGLVFFGINLFWVTSLFRFAGWWTVTGWVGLVLFQTLFVFLLSAFCFLLSDFFPKFLRPLLISILWVAIEWLRAFGPFGVTGGGVGYSQTHFLPLIQIASFAQVYGVSFVIVFFNASLAELMEPATERRGSIALALILIVLALGYGYFELRINRDVQSRSFPKLALIQPNIDQFDKMDPGKVMEVYDIHEALTRQAAAAKPDFIIWPETSVFTYLMRNPVLLPRVQKLARETGAWLIIGTPYYDDLSRAYNSIVSLNPSGELVSVYNKERLVPFGEYLPFRELLFPLLKGTGYFGSTFTVDPQPKPLLAGGKRIAAAVCFESTFPDLIRRRVSGNFDLILTVTNDGWFDDSAAPYQHFEAGVFRAIENRKYFVQAGNTGFSGVIDPYGRTTKVSKLNERVIVLSE